MLQLSPMPFPALALPLNAIQWISCGCML